MRQRLGVARCLLADPELLVLDEPMNGLDPAGIHELRQMIRSLVAEGRTVLLSSHLLDEVEKTCDRVAIIDQGKVLAQGPMAEIGRLGGVAASIGCRDAARAASILAGHLAVASIAPAPRGLVVTLSEAALPDPEGAVAAINHALVTAGIAVFGIEPVRRSLEQRYLEMTSTLGGDR